MYTIITNCTLKEIIEIDKLGIKFRQLNKKEKEGLINDVNEIYIKHKQEINNLSKAYKENDDLKVSLYLEDKYNEKQKTAILFSWMMKKEGFKPNSITKIKKILERMIVIEYKKEKLIEYVDEKTIKNVISNILSFYDIYSTRISFNEKVRFDYTFLLSENDVFDKNLKDYDLNILINIIFNYDKKQVKYVELSEKYLIDIKKFISKCSKEEIRRFLQAIDLIYSKHNMIQNRIINNVMIIEGILLNSDKNIQQNYTLKTGIIIKEYLKSKNKNINELLKKLLDYTYNIRSSIVHGNETNILNQLNTIKQNKELETLFYNKDDKKYTKKKEEALSLCIAISTIAVRATMKYWIEYPDRIDYMKKN